LFFAILLSLGNVTWSIILKDRAFVSLDPQRQQCGDNYRRQGEEELNGLSGVVPIESLANVRLLGENISVTVRASKLFCKIQSKMWTGDKTDEFCWAACYIFSR
jgi:hypothetical protein